ncbi:MAG: HAMP domain-containing histidine kinase [Bdellovibrionales bacterium]|nr:HAMP domain-containing histidine kinase [Bdellovibrionales bacterium]
MISVRLLNHFLPINLSKSIGEDEHLFFDYQKFRLTIFLYILLIVAALFYSILNYAQGNSTFLVLDVCLGLIGALFLGLYKLEYVTPKNAYCLFLMFVIPILSVKHFLSPTGMYSNLFWMPIVLMTAGILVEGFRVYVIATYGILLILSAEYASQFYNFKPFELSQASIDVYNLVTLFNVALVSFVTIQQLLFESRELHEQIEDQIESNKKGNELKTALLSLVCHDISNSISVINGVSHQILRDSSCDPNCWSSNYKLMSKHSRFIKKEIKEVRQFLSVKEGKLSISCHPTDLGKSINTTLENLTPELEKKNISIVMDQMGVPEHKYFALAESHALNQIIHSLLNNAIKYSYVNSKIELSVMNTESEIYLRILDFGSGTPKELLSYLKGENFSEKLLGATEAERGIGISLSTTQLLLDKFGAKLNIQTAKPSVEGTAHGTQIEVTFIKAINEKLEIDIHRHDKGSSLSTKPKSIKIKTSKAA